MKSMLAVISILLFGLATVTAAVTGPHQASPVVQSKLMLAGDNWPLMSRMSGAEVGDRVQVTAGHCPPVGARGTVIAISREDNQILVRWDRDHVNGFAHQWIGSPAVGFEAVSPDGVRRSAPVEATSCPWGLTAKCEQLPETIR